MTIDKEARDALWDVAYFIRSGDTDAALNLLDEVTDSVQ